MHFAMLLQANFQAPAIQGDCDPSHLRRGFDVRKHLGWRTVRRHCRKHTSRVRRKWGCDPGGIVKWRVVRNRDANPSDGHGLLCTRTPASARRLRGWRWSEVREIFWIPQL